MKREAIATLLLAIAGVRAGTVEIEVMHRMGPAPLRMDALTYALPTGETYSIERLSYLLSEFRVQSKEGQWQRFAEDAAWMDLGRRRQRATLTGVPPGIYRAIEFSIGLDAERNGASPASFPAGSPLNPAVNGLHWNWQGGFIFLALEGRYRGAKDEAKGYSFHFARDLNRTTITLPCEIEVGTASQPTVELSFDVSKLLNGVMPISFERDGNSTHSLDGDGIAKALRANLPAAFSATARKETSAPSAQTVEPLDFPSANTPYRFILSRWFPIPELPLDNPLIEERVTLGRRLFEDAQLSRDGSLACASCHDVAHAFSESRRVSIGVDGRVGNRNAMPLFNLAWKRSYFWDGRAASLREQALMPIANHLEMDQRIEVVVSKLERDREMARLFAKAFSNPKITAEHIGLALESYLLTLTSYDSKFDRAMRGEDRLNEDEARGRDLFFTEYDPRTGRYGADCFHCHGGALFSDYQFHNNGLQLAERDAGRMNVTNRESDRGKFATPSLRNVALTAPYMHDGRFATLEEVVAHYAGKVQASATLDPNLAKHPAGGVPLSREDQVALVSFLRTLTDEQYLQTGRAEAAR